MGGAYGYSHGTTSTRLENEPATHALRKLVIDTCIFAVGACGIGGEGLELITNGGTKNVRWGALVPFRDEGPKLT